LYFKNAGFTLIILQLYCSAWLTANHYHFTSKLLHIQILGRFKKGTDFKLIKNANACYLKLQSSLGQQHSTMELLAPHDFLLEFLFHCLVHEIVTAFIHFVDSK
jgi:hypothetical protein